MSSHQFDYDVSVIITVGPNPVYKQFLYECYSSITSQEFSGTVEIILVDDAAHIAFDEMFLDSFFDWKLITNTWNLGQAASINIGCAAASGKYLLIIGGSDDRLLPGAIQKMYDTAESLRGKFCVYPVLVTSEGETSDLPQGVWMLPKWDVWGWLGGYPYEAGIGEVDSIFCSVMLKNGVSMNRADSEPLYWHREHPDALTANKSSLRAQAAGIIREMCTKEVKPDPQWADSFRRIERERVKNRRLHRQR